MDQEPRDTSQRNSSTTAIAVTHDFEESNAGTIGSCLSESVTTRDKDANTNSEEDDCVIDIDRDGFSGENNTKKQKVCRICHLNAKESGKRDDKTLIELGCGCKGELGFAHSDCAEAWFKVKGNRLCEICDKTATNITGVSDVRFMESWNDNATTRMSDDHSYIMANESNRRFFRGPTLCNFLMACLVIAFILPWFFRVDVF